MWHAGGCAAASLYGAERRNAAADAAADRPTIVEALVQGGRVAFTKLHTLADRWHSDVQLLASNGSAVCAVASVRSMGCGWVGVDDR